MEYVEYARALPAHRAISATIPLGRAISATIRRAATRAHRAAFTTALR
ncbi:hypothetical protein [Streptomyces sp. NPDC048669]